MELCLFDEGGGETRRDMARGPDDVWRARVEGVGPGAPYGYRAHGPYEPRDGLRFNPRKLLLDPYARAMAGALLWDDAVYGYRRGAPEADLSFGDGDAAPFVPKGLVTAPETPATHDRPRVPWRDTVIYEAHVKGLTRLHPDLPEPLRGRYAALGHPVVVEHLLRLGVTALELLPVHAFVDDRFLVDRGLRNYWGYSTLSFFAPEARYGTADELKGAVRALHAAGIEVILDVVYNHTAESDELGPTLSWRGLDNAGWYRLAADRRFYVNHTGTGNTLDFGRPHVVRMAVDSLRHWADAYGVDGFRFDLGPVLGRDPDDFTPAAAFFAAVAADPVLSGLKMIAEPWDVGPGGYRLGGFPEPFAEWNDRFRDGVRSFWRGDRGAMSGFVRGLAGSREIFEASGRGPLASVNFVTSHDGFTGRDLASFTERRNEANGEGNRDGHGHNLSANGGVEGETDDPEVLARRARAIRNLLASVFLAQGVPMLLAGDELSRTQGGNNNAYCQDGEVNWLDWEAGRRHDPDLPAFVARLAALRRRFAALRRGRFFLGEPDEAGRKDVVWLAPDAREMTAGDWDDGERRTFGMLFGRDAPDGRALLLIVNAGEGPVAFALPADVAPSAWAPVLDSTRPDGAVPDPRPRLEKGGTFDVPPRSTVLFEAAG